MAAAVGMAFGVVQFALTRRHLGDAGRYPTASADTGRLDDTAPPRMHRHAGRWLGGMVLGIAALVALVWGGAIRMVPVTLQAVSTWVIVGMSAAYFCYLLFFAGLTVLEKKRVGVLVLLFVGCAVFWSGFEQAGSSFNLFAERFTDRRLDGFTVPAGWFQSLNAIDIVVFAPVFSALWIWLARRNLDLSASAKFTLGLIGMALGFLFMAAAARIVAGGRQAGMGWLMTVYLIHTFGELCLSPVGLSAVSKLVPLRFVGQSLGVWFVATSLGELIASLFAGQIDAQHPAAMPGQYMNIFWFGAVAALLLWLLTPIARRWSGGVR
jgi:POT family proton-dependent oligopeptide transporter